MRSLGSGKTIRPAAAAVCALLIALPASFGQVAANPPSTTSNTQPAAPVLPADQLETLVAPVALYPDPLLSQVLAASTYPLEIIEAQQWLRQNSNLQGTQLMDAAKRQNWDPSVQALVAFPDALGLLANDIRWTTDLGNAFLAQQTDVMSAVQRMRLRAKANGKLSTTPQQVVTTDTQDGQEAVEIQPANPDVIYVPIYSPAYIWGPPVWVGYPDLWYPYGYDWGFGFGPGIYMSVFYPNWLGWGGWGWGCGWFGRSLFLNTGFFHRYGFHGGYYGGFRGGYGGRGFRDRTVWTHDPGHRVGVPYPNRALASQFNSNRLSPGGISGGRVNGSQFAGGARPNTGQWNRGRIDAVRPGNALPSRGAAGIGPGGSASPSPGQWRHFGDASRLPSAGQPASPGQRQRFGDANRSPSAGQTSSPGQWQRFGDANRLPSAGQTASPGQRRRFGDANRLPSTGQTASPGQWQRFGDGNRLPSAGPTAGRGFARSGDSGFRSGYRGYSGPTRQTAPGYGSGGVSRSYRAPMQNPRGYGGVPSYRSAPSYNRSFGSGYSSPRPSYSAPRSYSAPSFSGGRSGFSGGGSGFSGGRSGGYSGSSGGRSGFSGGGGRSGGGGGHRR